MFNQILSEVKGDVLDLGCGIGRLMKPGWHGVDISKNMLKIAKKNNPKSFFVQNDGRTIPYKKEIFDYVVSILLFQHIPLEAVKGYIRETYRVLKNNGVFIFQFISGNENEPFSQHHDLFEIMNYLITTGFNTEKPRKKIHHQWTWVRAVK